ncbi:tripartite tricarboxylate transporter TctB family protein [Pseudonocardia charpentierae]|uniref:Tripartite tricarboxylate transporter TctB family protein n=1 Tax=Pseudonocardia charpentierae TaxID=3075545 RepID=A0ABU2NGD0_9PSEU|nr:tripartite tricarboxylate transporter TctB family protein [Pseudonocardia sp. DSM 45834]MDT0353012.1 tripartite tricarboxylate transporter TctB family protein [Pseudonocardia sp. DSM 45834]
MTPSEVPDPGLTKSPPPDRRAGRDPRPDLLAGGTFVIVGLMFVVASSRYELGSALQMGPGYYPLVLGGLLVALGVGVAVEGLFRRRNPRDAAVRDPTPAPAPRDDTGGDDTGGDDAGGDDADSDDAAGEERGPVPWMSMALVVAAIVAFALGVRELGLVPALLIATFLAALAGRRNAAWAAGVAVGLTVLCVLIFVVALQLRLPLVGSLFTG